MKNNYRQKVVTSSRTHFSAAPMSDVEFSRMHSNPTHYTDFSAGDIVPIANFEVLPNDTFDISVAFDIRQATVLVPTMGAMEVDIVAMEVPNRVVNKSWKAVMGENMSGAWTANEVSLAPLCISSVSLQDVQVPVCSVADYYGYPTQEPLSTVLLEQSHDLLFRGYLECYNVYFRDQNYQPPIPYSKLNVYNGFMADNSSAQQYIPMGSTESSAVQNTSIGSGAVADGSFPRGAIVEALYGQGGKPASIVTVPARKSVWSALDRPLKANKLHDYFTSVLPSPQKGREIVIGGFNDVPVVGSDEPHSLSSEPIHFMRPNGEQSLSSVVLGTNSSGYLGAYDNSGMTLGETGVYPDNLFALTSQLKDISLDDLRMSAAIQQVYELLGRGGSRYTEYINTFFGLEVENPFDDIPTFLGRIRRNLDLYQVAQTAQGDGTSVGTLGAFGYTSNGGHLFTKTFKEHGYVHIFAIVRHRNIYPALFSRDKMRMSMLDFYQPQLANISEQPVYTREINPFANQDFDYVFGYQEAWAEYRYDNDIVTGHMRTGVADSLAFWNYADNFDRTLEIADGEFMKSNSAEVLNRSIAIPDTYQPQFKGQFAFNITKQRPMPTYSVPGLDII